MQFLCDEVRKVAVESLLTEAGKSFADPAASESLIVSACRIAKINGAVTPRLWEPLSPASGTFRAAVGKVTQAPIAGTFTVTFGANTTSALAYNVSAAALSTALNALASITSAGGVSVALDAGGDFLITFTSHGSRAEITADAANLAPEGTIAEIGTFLNGTSTISEVQFLRFVQSPAALADLTDAAPDPAAVVDAVAVGGAGVNAKYRVTLYTSDLNRPYDGRWSVTLGGVESGLIAWDAKAEDVVTALEAMTSIGAGNVSVFLESPGVYLIGMQGARSATNTGAMTVDASALRVVPYMSGALDLRTPAVQLLFAGAATVLALFVIEYTPAGGSRREIYRQEVTLVQALLAQGSLTPSPVISFYTKTEADAATAAALASLSFGSMATQDANSVAITGGSITGISISGVSGSFTHVNGFLLNGSGAGITIYNNSATSNITLGTNASLYVDSNKAFSAESNIDISADDSGGTVIFNIGAGGTLGTGAFAPVAAAANPTGSAGLTAVNGSAITFMRSDGAPAISQAITPTWTGAHVHNAAVTFNAAFTCSPASGTVTFNPTSLGSINNFAIGGTTPAGGQFSSLKIGPSATPGTQATRMKFGVATLVAGTVAVGESTITTNTRIQLTAQSLGTVTAAKALAVTARSAGASFTITSADATDTSVVGYLLIEP